MGYWPELGFYYMPQGWIKLHRKLSKKAFYNKPNYLALWVHILLSANHEEREFMWNGKIITVKKGQFITGRKQLAEQSGISETTVERLLTFFEKEQQIGQQKTSKYRLITIYKWHEYQIMDNKRTTSGQQADTNKNVKNINNISEQSSQTDMGWKQYNENKHSDDLPVVDSESGEVVDPDTQEKSKNKELTQRKNKAIDWLIEYQGRDILRTNRPKQMKALNEILKMNVSLREAADMVKEQMVSDYWKGKQEKPDFSTVASIIQKRG